MPTQLKALRILADENVVRIRQGARADVIQDDPSAVSASSKERLAPVKPAGERVYIKLKDELLYGRWSRSKILPSKKDLSTQLRVSRPTLDKVLKRLQRENLIRRVGSVLQITPYGSSHTGASIVLIARSIQGRITFIAPDGHRLLNRLEHLCQENGIDLIHTRVTYRSEEELAFSIDWTRPEALKKTSRTILGFIVQPDILVHNGVDLLKKLARHGLPIALLCPLDFSPPATAVYTAPLAWITTESSADAGSGVARHLWQSGHRHIAWVSMYANRSWSRTRLQSLNRQLYAFGADEISVAHYLVDEAELPVPPAEIPRRIKWELDLLAQKVCEESRDIKRLPHALVVEWISALFELPVREMTQRRLLLSEQLPRVHTLLSKVAANRKVSAIVCANDELAILCKRFLALHKRRVPQDVSLCSFDDSSFSINNLITSYNFNTVSTINLALAHITRPPRAATPGHWKSKVINADGFLSIRESSRSVVSAGQR